jgi:hypothetical protein
MYVFFYRKSIIISILSSKKSFSLRRLVDVMLSCPDGIYRPCAAQIAKTSWARSYTSGVPAANFAKDSEPYNEQKWGD